MADSEVRQKFEAWCPINVINAAKAPRSYAIANAYWTAWQAAYSAGMRAGEIAMKEKAARESKKEKHMKNATGHWLDSNHAQSEQIARAIRALPLSGAEESKEEKA